MLVATDDQQLRVERSETRDRRVEMAGQGGAVVLAERLQAWAEIAVALG